MSRQVSSAFYARLQEDGIELAELIDLTLPNGSIYRWTTANGELKFGGNNYTPFPGKPGNGLQESIDLGVSVVDFVIANSGPEIQLNLLTSDFALATVDVGRVFTDTPDLGRMTMYFGKMGDFSYNRLELTGQARNKWKSLNVQWPYYTYQEKCGWRFGSTGCGFNTQSVTLSINTIDVGSSTTLDVLCHSLAGALPGTYDFGRATITSGTNSGAIRTIRAQTGDLVSFSYVLPNPDLTGMTLQIYPGCKKRLLEDCHSRYNNDKNFLGFPWIPVQEDAW